MSDNEGKAPILMETIKAAKGLIIEVWDTDYQHALDGHPEVNIDKIKESLTNPYRVVKSKKSNVACLFYSIELVEEVEGGEPKRTYFCVVVRVLSDGKGKVETAYETTYMKTGDILHQKKEEQ